MPHAIDHHAILDALAATRGGTRNAFAAIDPMRFPSRLKRLTPLKKGESSSSFAPYGPM